MQFDPTKFTAQDIAESSGIYLIKDLSRRYAIVTRDRYHGGRYRVKAFIEMTEGNEYFSDETHTDLRQLLIRLHKSRFRVYSFVSLYELAKFICKDGHYPKELL